MKTYQPSEGTSLEDPENVIVAEWDDKTGLLARNYPLPLRLDVYNHSPTGFAWGYGGSGPHQLALALLLDVTKSRAKSLRYYHQLVIDTISGLDDNGWKLTDTEILAWLDGAEKTDGART